jgi:D-beta-D-heptose 7-phosphate kinase/D-beta-D-heptose 1-phosphate adenosyltransferase
MNRIDMAFNTDLVQAFSKCRVLVVGDLMLDQYWWGSVDRISPEAPVPVVKLDRVSLAAGGAANVAANVAGLGAEPLLVGTIGKDSESQLLADHLRSLGISSAYLTRTERPTSVKTRIVAHSQHVVRIDREQSSAIDVAEEANISKSVENGIARADVVILSDYAKGTLTNSVLATTIAAAVEHQVPILVDPKGKDFSKYRGASILTPNKREALEACRLDDHDPDVVAIAGDKLIKELALDAVVITEGEKGMTLFESNKSPVTLRAAAHEIYDVTGAGDTVIACLAVGLAAGLSRYDAVRLANIAAGLVVEQVGTTAISVDLLVEKFNERSFSTSTGDAAQL